MFDFQMVILFLSCLGGFKILVVGVDFKMCDDFVNSLMLGFDRQLCNLRIL